ncbi:acetate/propionate family kinase [Pseudonocardia endophytica]|uniref:Acetate kinase n=1 Tax=Pseudonocardia endophytica TaxID=401976 RepID=A0A4R1HK28_PSEEN|nr:acetate/propionate family kinase [Pseudonocardia endophytica]TCK22744.1 acetate kinase [Pseudonocardia endophytica]
MRVLVVNAGSSSLKLSLLDVQDGTPDPRPVAARTVERWAGEEELAPIEEFLSGVDGPVDVVGHRVVHGGPTLSGPTALDGGTLDRLAALTELAPLHQPRSLAGVRAVTRLLPAVPAVAAFDTAFHATLDPAASTYALPREWNRRWGLRRYGFHGLSHAYAVRRAAALVGRPVEDLRVVSAHLGAGASLAAVDRGRSVDTTMGFTPLAGLVMATRSGSVDPGLLLWLLARGGVGIDDLADALEHRAGLAGLTGTTGDMRDVLAARAAGDADAALALDVFGHRLAREVAAMTAATRGIDVLVATGGVGEHAAPVRADLADRLAHLGVRIDPARNADARGDARISAVGAEVETVVVTAREDLEIARAAAAVHA